MKTIKFIAMIFIATLVFVSCQNEDALEKEDVSAEKYPEIASKLKEMYFNTDDLVAVDLNLPDGTKQKAFEVEGDITFTEEQIMNMQMGGNIESKQYRTYNLVSTPWWGTRTITIIGYTGANASGLSNKERTALRWAVNNYNSLNLKIRFQLTFGTNYGPKDIVVYRANIGFTGGKAGFPANGNPYKWVRINGMNIYSTNVNEHVLTHEIGHAVGFRHTDWNTRASCGGTGEAAGTDGAVHIPGTPWGYDSTSLMLACFPSNSNGEFNANDRTALNFLY